MLQALHPLLTLHLLIPYLHTPLWQQCAVSLISRVWAANPFNPFSNAGIHLIMGALAGEDLLQQSHMQLKMPLEAQEAT